MPLISSTLKWANQVREQLNMEPNTQWATEADLVDMPVLNNISLEYTGMTGDIVIKQADVILKIYPLLWNINYTTTDAGRDFTYYSQKQSLQDPAMTFAPFSIVANQIQNQGCAGYTYQNYGSNPYLRAPFFQISEQMSDNYQWLPSCVPFSYRTWRRLPGCSIWIPGPSICTGRQAPYQSSLASTDSPDTLPSILLAGLAIRSFCQPHPHDFDSLE